MLAQHSCNEIFHFYSEIVAYIWAQEQAQKYIYTHTSTYVYARVSRFCMHVGAFVGPPFGSFVFAQQKANVNIRRPKCPHHYHYYYKPTHTRTQVREFFTNFPFFQFASNGSLYTFVCKYKCVCVGAICMCKAITNWKNERTRIKWKHACLKTNHLKVYTLATHIHIHTYSHTLKSLPTTHFN